MRSQPPNRIGKSYWATRQDVPARSPIGKTAGHQTAMGGACGRRAVAAFCGSRSDRSPGSDDHDKKSAMTRRWTSVNRESCPAWWSVNRRWSNHIRCRIVAWEICVGTGFHAGPHIRDWLRARYHGVARWVAGRTALRPCRLDRVFPLWTFEFRLRPGLPSGPGDICGGSARWPADRRRSVRLTG